MSKEAIKVIEECLSINTSDDDNSCHSTNSFINIRQPDFTVKTVDKYDMNLGSINILYENFEENDDSFGSYNYTSQVVFSFDKGYAVAVNTGWNDMTFSGNELVLDIYEHDDYDGFDRTCLTDELREKMIDIQAHRIILNGKP